MKMSDVAEVARIDDKLQRIKAIRSWLDSFVIPRGVQLYTNGLIGMIEITQATSRSLLDEVERGLVQRLRELGVEP